MNAGNGPGWRVGYFVSEYPSRSHTFIRREIEVLEARGLDVARYSQRKIRESELLNLSEQEEFDRTRSLFPISIVGTIRTHLESLLRQPARYLGVLVQSIRRRPAGKISMVRSIAYFLQGISLAEVLKEDKIDFLHIHFINSGVHVAAVAADFNGIRWGVSIHGRSDFDFPCVRALSWIAESAEFIRCISIYGVSQAKRSISTNYWHKVFVCYSGIPSRFLRPQQKRKVDEARVPVLLSVGRLSEEKGFFLLLEVASELEKSGQRFVLKIIGDGPERPVLEGEIARRKLSHCVELPGPTDEESVLAEMANADCYVCSSLMEGLPQVILEAMATNLVVVAPYLAGIPEAVIDEKTGLLYYCSDKRSLFNAVSRLLDNKELASRLAMSASRLVEGNFLIETSIEPLYERIIRVFAP